MLAVGDASGDAYAADFVRALRELRPNLRALGLGGERMAAAGVELVAHQRELAVGGFVELLPDLHRVVRTWFRVGAALARTRPDLLVLVDSAGVNVPFARRAQRKGVPILYYVCPQVWAWRRRRVRKIARRVDRLAAIFPFESEVYAGSKAAVDYVGHPLVDRLGAEAPRDREAARRSLGLPAAATVVALFPGSRRDEVRHCLPVMTDAAAAMLARRPELHFALPVAPSLERAFIERRLDGANGSRLPIRVVEGRSLDVLVACDVALSKPGTTTLEAVLLERPLVVTARASALTAVLVRRLVQVDSLTLPNLIAGRAIVPELLQGDAVPERIADAVLDLLDGEPRSRQLAAFADVRRALGGGGAARRAAQVAEEMLVARGLA